MREGRAILSCAGIRLIQPIFDSAKSGPANPWPAMLALEHRCLKVHVTPVTLLVTKVPVQARREVT